MTITASALSVAEAVAALPKVELHVHLEGCVRPELALELAEKNGVEIPYKTVAEIEAAKDFGFPALQNFLAFHYTMLAVVREAEDVYRIASEFFAREIENNVRHVEVYVGFQDFLDAGIDLDALVEALVRARGEGEEAGLSIGYIYGANRGLPAEDACRRLALLDAYPGLLVGVGTCSEETGHPPVMFAELFDMAVRRGYRVTSHCDCDQENALEHIRQCVQDLPVERIDHGIDILASQELIDEAAAKGMHFVMTPTSRPSDPEPRRTGESLEMAQRGLSVSFGTDDPDEFISGYANTMYTGLIERGPYDLATVVSFLRMGIEGSWASAERKAELRTELDAATEELGIRL